MIYEVRSELWYRGPDGVTVEMTTDPTAYLKARYPTATVPLLQLPDAIASEVEILLTFPGIRGQLHDRVVKVRISHRPDDAPSEPYHRRGKYA